MAALRALGKYDDQPLSENIHILEQTPQIKGMLTIINDRTTTREEFIFYFDRLSTLLVEKAMDFICYSPATIETPQNLEYAGLRPSKETSAVVILRSGCTLETGLRRVVPDARIGRILIQSNSRTGEPELHYQKVHPQIAQTSVLVLDPQIATGAGALMGIRVVKDYGVKEEDIIFITAVASSIGLRRVSKAFPKVKVVAGLADAGWERRWIDTRYFGC